MIGSDKMKVIPASFNCTFQKGASGEEVFQNLWSPISCVSIDSPGTKKVVGNKLQVARNVLSFTFYALSILQILACVLGLAPEEFRFLL